MGLCEKNSRNAEMERGAGNLCLEKLIRQVNEDMRRVDAETDGDLYFAELVDRVSDETRDASRPEDVLGWMNYAQI